MRRFRDAAVSTVTVFLAACGLNGLIAQNAQAADNEVRVVATFLDSIPASAALKVAYQRGYFNDAGLQLTFASALGGGDTLRPVTTGDADIAIGSPAASTLAVEKNPGLKIAAIWVPYNALDFISAKPLDKLDGALLGGSIGGSTVNLLVIGLQEQMNMKFEVQKAGTGSQADNWDAVRAGHLQASYAMEPFMTQRIQNDGAVVAINSTKWLPDFPLDFVVVNAKYESEHEKAMQGFFQAVDRIFSEFSDPSKQVALAHDLAGVMVFPEPVIKEYLTTASKDRLSKTYNLKMNANVLKNVSHLMQQANLISAPVEWSKYVDQSYLPAGDKLAELP